MPIVRDQPKFPHTKMYRDAEIQVNLITETHILVENADMKISYPVQEKPSTPIQILVEENRRMRKASNVS